MFMLGLTGAELKIMREVIETASPNKPYTISEVRRAMDVIRRADEAGQSDPPAPILLEKEEHAFIKQRLEGTQWLRAGADILSLVDKIEAAKDVKVEPVKPLSNGADHEQQPQA